jgi:hypothetical protein
MPYVHDDESRPTKPTQLNLKITLGSFVGIYGSSIMCFGFVGVDYNQNPSWLAYSSCYVSMSMNSCLVCTTFILISTFEVCNPSIWTYYDDLRF